MAMAVKDEPSEAKAAASTSRTDPELDIRIMEDSNTLLTRAAQCDMG
jgi:uncharacterized protein (DUF1778 family)